MATTTIEIYNALVNAGIDEPAARKISEDLTNRNEDMRILTTKVNMLIGINVAVLAGLLVLIVERIL